MSDDAEEPIRRAMMEAKRSMIVGENYHVGYGKPPMATRFQKGQSGNPDGRRRQMRHTEFIPELLASHEAILEEARGVVAGGSDGKPAMTALRAVLKAQFKLAMKDNAVAQREYLANVEKALAVEKVVIEFNHEIWRSYVADCREEIAAAKRHRKPHPDHLPHPDDLVFEPGERVCVHGPMTKEQRDAIIVLQNLRDIFILQHAMELQLRERRLPPRGETCALLIAILINACLPGRYKLDDESLEQHVWWHLSTKPQRKILKVTYQAWREIGLPRPRGTVMPSQASFVAKL